MNFFNFRRKDKSRSMENGNAVNKEDNSSVNSQNKVVDLNYERYLKTLKTCFVCGTSNGVRLDHCFPYHSQDNRCDKCNHIRTIRRKLKWIILKQVKK